MALRYLSGFTSVPSAPQEFCWNFVSSLFLLTTPSKVFHRVQSRSYDMDPLLQNIRDNYVYGMCRMCREQKLIIRAAGVCNECAYAAMLGDDPSISNASNSQAWPAIRPQRPQSYSSNRDHQPTSQAWPANRSSQSFFRQVQPHHGDYESANRFTSAFQSQRGYEQPIPYEYGSAYRPTAQLGYPVQNRYDYESANRSYGQRGYEPRHPNEHGSAHRSTGHADSGSSRSLREGSQHPSSRRAVSNYPGRDRRRSPSRRSSSPPLLRRGWHEDRSPNRRR